MSAAPRARAADRFDPPLRTLHWRPPRAQTRAELLADARARLADDARFASALWHGGLHVDGRPLREDDPDPQVGAASWIRLTAFAWEPEPVEIGDDAVLHEDARLVAARKPAWITMQGSRASQRLSLEAMLRARLGAPGLTAVHRLDRQTSGVALFAKGGAAARALGRAFAQRRVEKRYLALVAPPPMAERFELRGALRRAAHPARPYFALAGEGEPGRACHARFAVLARDRGRALVLAAPTTGRTHQLRVQLAAAGSPIAGDTLYGPPHAPGAPSAAERVQLHAWRVLLPPDGERPALALEAEPPPDFEAAALLPCAARLAGGGPPMDLPVDLARWI